MKISPAAMISVAAILLALLVLVPASDASGDSHLSSPSVGTLSHSRPLSLVSPAAQSGGQFSSSVAVSGKTVVVGAPDETVSNNSRAGRTYVFGATTGTLNYTLTSPSAQAGGGFGSSVAISGKTVVVGAPGITPNASAYVFTARGKLISTLTSPCVAPAGYTCAGFGSSVAISGTTVVVGAPAEPTGSSQAGNAYVFNATSGALIATLTSPYSQTGGYFGSAVAISGTTVVVGAPGEKPAGAGGTPGTGVGNVYVFNATTSGLISTLASGNGQVAGLFGYAVAINGARVAVGAPGEIPTSTMGSGAAYIFDSNGTPIASLASPIRQIYGNFGKSVAISGTDVAVGAPGEPAYHNGGAGREYVFNASGGLVFTLFSSNPQLRGHFGRSAALSGLELVVGAPNESASTLSSAGRAYVIRV